MRIAELDLLRGLAVLLMISFHLIVDLRDFFNLPLSYHDGFWFWIGKASAVLFIAIAGVSSRFSRSLRRHGLRIFGWGLVLSAVTYFYSPAVYIRFGILHLLGVSLLLGSLLQRCSPLLLSAVGCSIVLIGNVWPGAAWLRQSWLLPLGYPPPSFASLDYYPLFPWFGLFLLGMAIGRLLYPQPISVIRALPPCPPLAWLGRHSLAVYLLHQPLLLLLLTMIFNIAR